jgi:hypothetical protein
MDVRARQTSVAGTDGQIVRSSPPDAEVKLADDDLQATGLTSPAPRRHPGESAKIGR